jgi:hypothetical protein
MRVVRLIAACAVIVMMPLVASATRAELAKARALYNQRQFDAAIAAAIAARRTPATADSAAIVEARAHLERYRELADPADLSAARTALGAVRVTGLDPRDQVEFLLALGQSMFLEDDFGAAAEVLESGLDAATPDPLLHEAMLEWWASAMDRQAAALARDARREAFGRVASRMTAEIAKDPANATATYWAVVALRGTGDGTRAWDAAVAAWARARLMGEHAERLRGDLNRLVTDGVIPDRVRHLPADQREAAAAQLKADWELVKEKWK